MASLGSFGEENTAPAEEQTFDYLGVTLRVNPDITDADMLDWLEEVGELDQNDPAANIAIKRLMRNVVLAEDFELFWSTAKQHRQTIAQRMTVIAGLVAAISNHPTSRPSDSSGGPERTVPSLPADFASPGRTSLPADFALAAQRRLEAQGRPDLAVAALKYREHLAAASG